MNVDTGEFRALTEENEQLRAEVASLDRQVTAVLRATVEVLHERPVLPPAPVLRLIRGGRS